MSWLQKIADKYADDNVIQKMIKRTEMYYLRSYRRSLAREARVAKLLARKA